MVQQLAEILQIGPIHAARDMSTDDGAHACASKQSHAQAGDWDAQCDGREKRDRSSNRESRDPPCFPFRLLIRPLVRLLIDSLYDDHLPVGLAREHGSVKGVQDSEIAGHLIAS